jgi:hypothetical protein
MRLFIFRSLHCLGEYQPNTEKIELPSDTKENLFVDFGTTREHKATGGCTYSYFCDIWKVHFPNLYMPRNARWVICLNSL